MASKPSTYDKSFVSKDLTPQPPQPKRIIICCDGTWQSATSLDPSKGCASNVARLSRLLANYGTAQDGKLWQQLVYYDAGIGTGNLGWMEKKRQGGLGLGLMENILEAYNFLVNNYCPGDELFFFGFSRGAYTVRATAGLVCDIGILQPTSMSAFLLHYNNYIHLKPRSTNFPEYGPWKSHVSTNNAHVATQDAVTIKVVGVWDTVGSLGVPDMGHAIKLHKEDVELYQFYNTDLTNQIEHAYQALALDEQRGPFSPSLWKLKTAKPGESKNTTKLVQCWFPGAHVNVGGGSSSNTGDHPTGDREQLASIAYAWMLDRIRPHLALSTHGLEFQIQEFKTLAETPTSAPQAEGWGTWLKSWVVDTSNKVMPVGYGLGEVDDSYTEMYQAMGKPRIRTPNQYHTDKEYTVERIHPCVYYRILSDEDAVKKGLKKNEEIYVPMALKGWTRGPAIGKKLKDGVWVDRKGWKWSKKDGNAREQQGLWEFEIGDLPESSSVEKKLIDVSWVKEAHELSRKQWRE